MDTQRKKGLLDICVLAVLKRGPSYGYMIMGEVSKCIEISESTLYPILKRLEQSGSVVTYKQEHNGRTRKYYEITEVGDEKIRSFLNEWEEIEKIYAFIQENSKEDAE
ncbi:MAG: PadR family transcriptional regulator [Lachnospiraceae bacterium]|jgi:PadR family transcriptional regulator PadR|nr:PadR family transcriptional regulator [Lachnospiraceae bacterium]